MKYLLAIDQGTSSTRAMIYTPAGQLIAMSQVLLKQYYPQPGWVEHCPEEIWSKTLIVIKEVVSKVDAKNIIACGITNQRETSLLWDKVTGQCIHKAIVWQDRRTEAYCETLQDYKTIIKEKTGLLPDPYFSASKLNWLFSQVPEARSLAKSNRLAFGTIDSFLIWRLTKGSQATDVTNASRTLLYNIFTEQWDKELLTIFDIPPSILPTVYGCDEQVGVIDKSFLGVSIPITGVAGDQQAALVGQHCFEKGMIKATYGTGGFLLMNTGENGVLSKDLLTTVAYQIKNQLVYGLEGSLYQAGTTIKWLRDEMKIIETAAETESLARQLSDNEGVYLIPSFTGLGAPHWIASQGAVICGLSPKSNRAHFARAALESVCYQTREILDCMRNDSGINIPQLRVDGGMAVNNWFLQCLSNQCQLSVQKPGDIETTAQGVAFLAALGCGEINSLAEISALRQNEQEFLPENNEEQRERNFKGWLAALKMLC